MAAHQEGEPVSREEFAEAVAATIGSVHHFYREVGRLYTALRETLQSEPDPFVPVGGYGAKPSKDIDRTIVRNWFGQLFEPNLAGEEEEEDDVDEDDADEGTTSRRKQAPALLYPDHPMLVVKLQLFHSRQEVGFEPELQYAVIGEWACGTNHAGPTKGDAFQIARSMLRRIVKAFDAAAVKQDGQRHTTHAMIKGKAGSKGVDKRISFRALSTPQRVALYELDSAEALEEAGRSIQRHWNAATSSSSMGGVS